MNRYALFIGISDYLDRYISNLRLAHRDAQNLHGLFRHRLGYGDNAILLPPNAGLREFNRQFNAIGEKIQAGDSFILYFAGHGHQHGDNQYLLLPEANRRPIEAGDVIGEELLSLNNLKTKVERWPDSDCLFILDACRSPIAAELKRGDSARYQGTEVLQRMFTRDPARRAPRPSNKELAAAAQAMVLNACGENDVAYEPAEGDAGVLCRALEAEIVASLQDGRTIAINADTPARLIGHIRRHWSDCPQTPWLSPVESSFVLHAGGGGAAISLGEGEKQGAGGASSLDERQWRLACVKNTEAAYESYIKESGPEAVHVDEAFVRLETLQEVAMEAKRQAKEIVRTEAAAKVEHEAAEAERLRQEGEERAWQEADRKRCAEDVAKRTYFQPGQVFRDADWAPEMVVIPAGEFWMGSPENEPDRDSCEGPQHWVKISRPFAVGRYLLTQREWIAMMGSNPSWFKGEYLPVEHVSWEDALAYVIKLNERLGLSGPMAYRLLSEAEWEYACRAGTTTQFSTGRTISTTQANFFGNESDEGVLERTMKVDSFAANGFGLHDMHGNVWEWVEDFWHDNYEGAPVDGGPWVTAGKVCWRVLRGGSLSTPQCDLRSASRHRNLTSDRLNYSGFRLARSL